MTNDPIADLLTRIRNAQHARHEIVSVPASRMKKAIVEILRTEGFIQSFRFEPDEGQGQLHLILKYDKSEKPMILGIRRVSSPGCRRYVSHREIPRVLNGLGISILSTSRGVMSDRDARRHGVGGELLAQVW
jgi:small subunit ribosomal protein S8